MTKDQFLAWLLFVIPVFAVFGGNNTVEQIIVVLVMYSFIPISLFVLGEIIFIKDVKKGYDKFEDSIFPLWCYRKWIE